MNSHKSKIFAIIAVIALIAYPASAGVRLEGFYENVNYFDGTLKWYMAEPHNNFELRLYANPINNVEAFLKFHGESDKYLNNNPADRYTIYDMLEAHVKYRWDKGAEVVLFARENRFWFSQGLMELVSQWTVNDGGNAQGARVDFWNLWKIYGTAIHSDYSQSGGEDANILRWNLPLFSDRFRLSSTLARKDWTGSSDNWNSVVAADAYFSLGRTVPFLKKFGDIGCAGEIAKSRIPGESDTAQNLAYRAELRNLRIAGLEMKFAYRNAQENFRSYLSNDFDAGQKYNEEGFNIQASYFFPTKAINLTTSYDQYAAPLTRNFPVSATNPARTYRESYNELYVEFIHDIRFKTYCKYYRGWDTNYDDYRTYPTCFGELSFENFLAKVRLQYKWKDFGTPYELRAFGIELNANISKNWKLYLRAMNVDEIAESRQTAFVQLQYLGWSSTDFFIEFGDPNDSNDDLTNDDSFVNYSANQEIKLQLKTYLRVYF